MKNNKKLNQVYLSMLLCRKYREKKDSDPDVDEETTNSSTNAFSQIYTNFNYNLMIIKEINRWKSKEEINEEESKMRKYLKEKTKEYYKSKRDLYTLKNLSYHKSKILGIISFSIYLTLFIVIVVLQLNISEAYSSWIVVQRITGEDVILGDTYFNFNDAPTFRNLNYSKEQTLIQNNYKNSKTHVSLNHLGLMDNTSFQKNVYSQNTIKSSLDHQVNSIFNCDIFEFKLSFRDFLKLNWWKFNEILIHLLMSIWVYIFIIK